MAEYRQIANLKGPAGDRGPAGDQGPRGYQGLQGERGLPALNAPTNDAAVSAYIGGPDTLSGRAARVASARAAGDINLLEWVDTASLPNRENGDAKPLFDQVMADLASLYTADGRVYTAKAPFGRYAFSARLTPPLGGHFGIKGEGAGRTTFLTSAANSWLGMNQFIPGDPDFQWEQMFFEDFAIDGIAQPAGGSVAYVAGLKGFIMHNFRDSWFRRVHVRNTHATGFGIDYSNNVWFIECVADNAGRGRRVAGYKPEVQFGSGSGYGIGFGQKQDETIFIINSVARNCGAAGIFGEQLGQPEARYKSTGLVVKGALVEGNAVGMNDTGTRGTMVDGLVARHNTYAGYRVGVSNASEQGGVDGQVKGLVAYDNLVGIALEGSADGTYLFDSVELFKNTRAAVEFRDTTNTAAAWPAPYLRFRAPHIHDNAKGVLGSTDRPIVGLQLTDVLIHDNVGAGIDMVSPLSRPKITGRLFGNGDFAIALRGSAEVETPDIRIDVHGSANGGLFNTRTVNGGTIEVTGNPTTVTQLVRYPVPPETVGTTWLGQAVTLSRETSFVGADGRDLGIHMAGTATGTSPRVIGSDEPVTGGQIICASVDVIVPWGMNVQPAVRFGSGSTATWVVGPLERGTGSIQTLHFALAVPAGQTVARPGAVGASGVINWGTGTTILRATRANITRGGQYWGYIAGDRPNCAWTSTPFASTSVLTIPTQVGGFYDDFERPNGPVGSTAAGQVWASAVNTGTAVPLTITSGRAGYGTGGTASRSVWTLNGGSANGVLEAQIGAAADHAMSLIVRGTDAANYIALDWARDRTNGNVNYRLSKRLTGTLSEITPITPTAASAAGDIIQIILTSTTIEAKVNGTSLFGGPIAITDFNTVTRHGLMLVGDSPNKGESIDYIKWTPAA